MLSDNLDYVVTDTININHPEKLSLKRRQTRLDSRQQQPQQQQSQSQQQQQQQTAVTGDQADDTTMRNSVTSVAAAAAAATVAAAQPVVLSSLDVISGNYPSHAFYFEVYIYPFLAYQ